MSELDNSDFKQMERAVKQAWELTCYIERLAKEFYSEDYVFTDVSIKALGIKQLIEGELLFALEKIDKIKLEQGDK